MVQVAILLAVRNPRHIVKPDDQMRTLTAHIHALAFVNARLQETHGTHVTFLHIPYVFALYLLPTAAFIRGFSCCVDKGLWRIAGHLMTDRGNANSEGTYIGVGCTFPHPDAEFVFKTQLPTVIHSLCGFIVDEKHTLSGTMIINCVWQSWITGLVAVVLINFWTI